MRIAVFGTGMVGEAIGNKLVSLGHEVRMGSRTARNGKAIAWANQSGERASHGTFADAATFGELAFNCTSGVGSVEAVTAAGAQNLAGKILIDITNPLDFSKGFPPTLSISNADSLGEAVQRALPSALVVKTLNTVNCNLMVNPGMLAGGEHTMFLCGNDAGAKAQVRELLESFGWKDVIDLGDISMSRGLEMYLPLWVRLFGALKTPNFNVKIVK
jgi:8-hydroxy-5-deazaflavin:NADPH oxidoreductase